MVILYLTDLSFVAYYYIQKLKKNFFSFVLFYFCVVFWFSFAQFYVLTLYVWCYLYKLMQFKYVNDILC